MDLFASRLNTKLPTFVSWHPEPGAMAVDAFSISWSNLRCYAFTPFSLRTQVLRKIREDKALMCYSLLSSVDEPELISRSPSVVDRQTDSTAQERKSPVPTSQRCPPTFERQTGSGCIDVIWKSLRDRDISDEATQLIAASWSSGTDKQYNSV